MGGQIVDATVVEARRPRLNRAEKETITGGGVPPDWNEARTRQIDRDGRWTLKRGKKRSLSKEPEPHGSRCVAAWSRALSRGENDGRTVNVAT